MRKLPIVLLALTLSGCGMGTEGALTAQDANSALKAKNGAVSQLAMAQLSAIQAAAANWSAANGGVMTGFAADLQSSQPSVASAATTLTDRLAVISLGAGQCLSVTLPTGQPSQGAC